MMKFWKVILLIFCIILLGLLIFEVVSTQLNEQKCKNQCNDRNALYHKLTYGNGCTCFFQNKTEKVDLT